MNKIEINVLDGLKTKWMSHFFVEKMIDAQALFLYYDASIVIEHFIFVTVSLRNHLHGQQKRKRIEKMVNFPRKIRWKTEEKKSHENQSFWHIFMQISKWFISFSVTIIYVKYQRAQPKKIKWHGKSGKQ